MRFLLVSACLMTLLAVPAFGEDPVDKGGQAKAVDGDKPYGPPNPAWLTPRVLRSRVGVPALAGREPDGAPLEEGEPGWVVVTLGAGGALQAGGGEYELGSLDPGVQDDNIQAFTQHLRQLVPSKQHRNEDGTSKLRALIYADRGTQWKYVQWVMQAFAQPGVRVHRIAFALRRAETAAQEPVAGKGEASRFARFDVTLPRDAGAERKPPPTVQVKVFGRDHDEPGRGYTYIKVDNMERGRFGLPPGWRGRLRETPERIDKYDETLKALQEVVRKRFLAHGVQPPEGRLELVAPPPKAGIVPFGDVANVIAVAADLGITDLVFQGAATPLTSGERAARRAQGGR